MTARQATETFLDGCHRYGWVITVVINLMALAYFTGGMHQELIDVKNDVQILKSQVYDLAHAPRGLDPEYDERKDKELGIKR